ncbi:MAG: LysM peptidoglycan-binding domain-containing protein [Saprospiraceae bacterium]|nr:LysM peptidoglycan-binding domain-containing protein [Saprospiraceae bacterium]
MRGFISSLLLFFLISPAGATGDSLNYLTLKDTIFITLGPQGDNMFTHHIAPKQTLYSLAAFYGLSLSDLYLYNPELRTQGVKVGQGVRVPIPNRAIIRYKTDEVTDQSHIPVCYVVRKGDTMYRISKQFFRMPIDTIRVRNGLPDTNLKTGQALQIGWMSVSGIADTLRFVQGGALWQRSYDLGQRFEYQTDGKKEIAQSGVATWQKDRVYAEQELFILHRSAALNSIVALTNPMSRKTVYVQVIGRIPPNFDGSIIAVVTPTVAEMLGVIDPKFFVRVRYFK